MLSDYCNNSLTDKNTDHSYVDVYQELFQSKRDTATHVLEVGIGPYMPNGGSILMWAGYFKNAEVHAVDIISINSVNPLLFSEPRVHLHTQNDAYNEAFFKSTFLNKPPRYDVLVDDGPHSLESMVTFIKFYSQVMKKDGILVVEDVQSIDWISTLREATPDELKPYIEVYDRRSVKGRWDDIMFVINCSRLPSSS